MKHGKPEKRYKMTLVWKKMNWKNFTTLKIFKQNDTPE